MNNTRVITEGAIMVAIFAALLFISNFVPIIGMVAFILLPVPFMIYRIRYNMNSTILLILVASIISLILFTIFSIPVACMAGVVGLVMGDLIAKEKGRLEIFLKTSVVYVLSVVSIFALSKVIMGVDFVEDMQTLFNEGMLQAQSIFKSTGQELPSKQVEMFKQYISFIPLILPTIFVLFAMIMSFFTGLLSMPIIKRLGYKVQNWPPIHELSLPKQLVGIYLLILIASFIPMNQESLTYIVVLNLLFLFQLLAIFQGITFIFLFFNKKKVTKPFRIAFVILLFFVPVLFSIVMLLGIIDLGFSLRNRL